MKTLLKILAGFVLLVVAVLGFVFWLTAGLPAAADEFFTKLAADDYEGAIALTTPDFRASTDRSGLESYARANGLNQYASASWTSRSVNNNVGKLEGSLTTKDGGVIPVSLELVKGDDGWRVQNVRKSAGGAITTTATSEPAVNLPSSSEQTALIDATLAAFAASVNGADFSPLHTHSATRFQNEVSAERLGEVFAGFVAEQVDLTVLDGMAPVVEKAEIDGDGVLNLRGHYPTEPSATQFDLNYEREAGEWRLIQIDVKIEAA